MHRKQTKQKTTAAGGFLFGVLAGTHNLLTPQTYNGHSNRSRLAPSSVINPRTYRESTMPDEWSKMASIWRKTLLATRH
jgi:hypothetical protein